MMSPIDDATAPWQDRVHFSPDGGFAYKPGEVLVRREVAPQARTQLQAYLNRLDRDTSGLGRGEPVTATYTRFRGVPDALDAVAVLRLGGIQAQVNHVLFATCVCPPHPAGQSVAPFDANPFYANPFYANPFYANTGGACGCGVGANPFYANPFYANPFYANRNPGFDEEYRRSGKRGSSARRATQHEASAVTFPPKRSDPTIRVTVLDTGIARSPFGPARAESIAFHSATQRSDVPDEDGDELLDPVAGHGTFIAGVVRQITAACLITVKDVMTREGVVVESDIAKELENLAGKRRDSRPDFVNLSFGGYSSMGMDCLADAVEVLTATGTVIVASAGNDATCAPIYPAALPGVIGVAALDRDANPAFFSNYGLWVRACAWGQEVVSLFFTGFDGPEEKDDEGYDPDDFEGYAVWSGTSFAAPRVVGALSQHLVKLRRKDEKATPQDAVASLIDDPERMRMPMMGTIVDGRGETWAEANWNAVKMAMTRRLPSP